MSEGPQDFDYKAAYIAEQGTRQYAERELQEARQEVERLWALLAGFAKQMPTLWTADDSCYTCACCYSTCDILGPMEHEPDCPWLQAKQALQAPLAPEQE